MLEDDDERVADLPDQEEIDDGAPRREEESLWNRKGGDRLDTFDRQAAVSHDEGWKTVSEALGLPGEFLRSTFEHPLSRDHCFRCTRSLNSSNRSDEHVIPKWVQERFQLWNATVTLLNGTQIPYRNLRIPCCRRCNNGSLSSIEAAVKNAVDKGVDAVLAIPPLILFQWLAKIFLGLLYKEHLLPGDRRQPSSEPITSAEHLRQFAILHFWLELATLEERSRFCPGSLFVFRTQEPSDPPYGFDLLDCQEARSIAIRVGSVGLIADFMENGVHAKEHGNELAEYVRLPLHPIQFRELASMVFYKALLLEQESKFEFFVEEDRLIVNLRWRSKVSEGYSSRKWVSGEYASILAKYVEAPLEAIFLPPRSVMTWLHDADGNLRFMPIEAEHD